MYTHYFDTGTADGLYAQNTGHMLECQRHRKAGKKMTLSETVAFQTYLPWQDSPSICVKRDVLFPGACRRAVF